MRWTDSMAWSAIEQGAHPVPDKPGVYEVLGPEGGPSLTIGKASSLRSRVVQALIRGNLPHSAGERIRQSEDTTALTVRYRVLASIKDADRLEAELHESHVRVFGALPKHTRRT